MIIAFETKRLREICEDDAVAINELGTSVAEALKQRLADVRAAESISDLIVGSPCPSGPDSSTLTISLNSSVRTVWSPNHVSPPRNSAGHIDWSRARRLLLREIAGT